MAETASCSVGLVVTSPPYWHIKDYGADGQLGYGQTLHEYLYDLSRVWAECHRVLMPGRRLCVNIGDQFARAVVYGQYKVIALHAEIIAQCESAGFDYLGAIIWQKKTTMRPSGGAVVMGSFPYPPNGIVELDYEFILIFRKPGKSEPPPSAVREASAMTRDEWKAYFSGHWSFAGERQGSRAEKVSSAHAVRGDSDEQSLTFHEAMFPEELPYRLIRMFSFVGETVLDPFAGSGTTLKVALDLDRNAVGYEIQPRYLGLMRQKLGVGRLLAREVLISEREHPLPPVPSPEGYKPHVKDARPLVEPGLLEPNTTYRVAALESLEGGLPVLLMDNGLRVSLLGVAIIPNKHEEVRSYLRRYVVGHRVILRFERPPKERGHVLPVYLYLTNRLFVNRKMIEMGLACADRSQPHRLRERFIAAENKSVVQRNHP